LKVLLVNPPDHHEIIGNNPVLIEEERGHNPPLGLLYLAACIEEKNTHEASVLDAQVDELGYPQIEGLIRKISPDVVGITSMSLTLIDVMRTVETVKRVDPNIKVVLGGPHAHLYPEETIALKGIDYLVIGEGEHAFLDLLDSIDDKEKLKHVKGIVFRQADGTVTNTGTRELIDDLDAIPFPARHLVPYGKYSSLMAKRSPITTMITSRGCPYRCTFCDRPHLGKRFRARSAMNVVDEMQHCTRMGIYEFLVYDDTFTVDRERVIAVCDEIRRRKLDIGWDIRARINNMDTELIGHLRAANCERIHYGVEAGTDKILKTLKKGITVDQAKEVFRATKKAGISTLGYFMLGNPGETLQDMEKTISLMKELGPDFVHITILTPFPGTRIYSDALDSGQINSDVWRKFATEPDENFVPPHWGEFLSREDLGNMLVRSYREFYIRPGYILKRLSRISSLGELRRQLAAGLKVLSMR
jgi:radical SAM superfamily enzyme YgiQ (UPF0313 family)